MSIKSGTTMQKSTSSRIVSYDLIRVWAMFSVIGLHVLGHVAPPSSGVQWWAIEAVKLLLFPANGLFFMLSGRFNLRSQKIGRFYVLRSCSMLLPFLVCSMLAYLVKQRLGLMQDGYISLLLGGYGETEYWFVYALVMLLAAAPFLIRMLQNLDEKECRLIVCVALVLQTLFVAVKYANGYLPFEFMFSGWGLYFLLGYMAHQFSEAFCRWLWLAAPVALVSILLQLRIFPNGAPNVEDFDPRMVLITVAVYTFLLRVPVEKFVGVEFISRYSYYVYLLHNCVITLYFSNAFGIFDAVTDKAGAIGAVAVCALLAFILPLLVGMVIHHVLIVPIINMVKK